MVRSNESTGDVGIVVAFTNDDDDDEISGVNVFLFSPSLVVVVVVVCERDYDSNVAGTFVASNHV